MTAAAASVQMFVSHEKRAMPEAAMPTRISTTAASTAVVTLTAASRFSSEANARPHSTMQAPSV